MADEISETKTRYERLDPNVVKVFRLADRFRLERSAILVASRLDRPQA